MKNKKKKVTAATALVAAGALLLGGTFAWQSISQTALNEKEAVINPGGGVCMMILTGLTRMFM